jgi:hypothetical protein
MCVLAPMVKSQALTNQVQSKTSTDTTYFSPYLLPASLQRQYVAIGDRLQKPGKERITLQGTLTIGKVVSPAQVIVEKGGSVSISSSAKAVTFDGTATSTSLNASDGSYVDAFADDTVETFMEAVAQGQGVRLVGRRFPSQGGGSCDLYDVAITSKAKSSSIILKRYCFDSFTALLRFVQYPAASAIGSPSQETHYSDWRLQSGQAVPGQITRIENGQTVFAFQASPAGVTVSARQNDGTFSK